MAFDRTRRRAGLVRKGVAALVTIYRQDRDLRVLASQGWRIGTRHGLVGLRDWLVAASWAAPAPDGPVGDPDHRGHGHEHADGRGQDPGRDGRTRYQAWLARFDVDRPAAVSAARRHLATLRLPEVLIVAVIAPETVGFAARMAASWSSSIHPGWRAVLVAPPHLSEADAALLGAVAADPRIAIVTTADEVAAARQRHAYALVCAGAVLLDQLSLYMMLEAAMRTGAGFVYADHDRIDEAGARFEPSFKPQFSPEYLARYNYVGACFLLSRSITVGPAELAALIGADLAGYDRAVARLTRGCVVEHVAFTLFHMMRTLPHAEHDLPAIPDSGPTAAIIIPTRDRLTDLAACIDSILERTAYDLDLVEIVVVDNDSVEPETLAYLDDLAGRPRFTVVRFPGAFNFAQINNAGARAARHDILVFVNNDTVVCDPAWLSRLVWHAAQPGVGIVGGRLLFPDGTVQHGGCAAGTGRGTVQHCLVHAREADIIGTDHTREMTVVTGACMAAHRNVLDRIGGFDPILRVTWNDVDACLRCAAAGLRNIYIGASLMIHHEARTRGHDDTRDRYHRFFSEADYTRRRFRGYFFDDPSYNPNLSSQSVGELAVPPRVRPPWSRMPGDPARILLLSAVYRIGFGVPLVMHQHAIKLRQLGYDVIVGGPVSDNDFEFEGCERVALGSVEAAAEYAFTQGVALAICHTPPFFTLPILLGGHIPVLAYDYGEPDAEFFPEPVRSHLLEVGYAKREAAALTTTIATISQAVKNETLNKDALVLGLANSHLPAWSEAFRPDRDRFRREQGWTDCFVVLTVCRYHENERVYKGLDKIAVMLREMPYLHPEQSGGLVWILAGAGRPDDIRQVEQLGFTVFPNVSDDLLATLYRAADAYMGMSRWEGYNLGISQALAMGLPTLGSDIPAHREFPIATTNSVLAACAWLAREVQLHAAAGPARRATVYDWDRSAAAVAQVVETMLRDSAAHAPRRGASGCVWQDAAECPA